MPTIADPCPCTGRATSFHVRVSQNDGIPVYPPVTSNEPSGAKAAWKA